MTRLFEKIRFSYTDAVSTQRRLTSKDRPYRHNPVTKRPMCRWCGKDVPPPKLTFCGPACVHEYLLRADPRYLRQAVFERDRGVCSKCGLDTVKLERQLWELETPSERDALKERMGMPPHRSSFWDADHVVPVVEGGGLCDLSNMTTLCCPCHFAKKKAKAA